MRPLFVPLSTLSTASPSTMAAPSEWWGFVREYATPIAWSLVVIAVAYFASKWLGRVVLTACSRGQLDITVARFLAKLSSWIVLLIAGTFVLGKFGIETASFSVLLGAVGLAISLAFQGTLSNFASGIMLMVFRPYKVGDAISAAGQTGVVYEIDLFSTTLDAFDNRRIFIPNSSIFGSVITNISYHERRRVDVPIVVAHGADSDATRRALELAASRTTGKLPDAPEVVFVDIAAHGIAWQVHVWANTADYLVVRQSALREVKRALDEAGIAFAIAPLTAAVAPVAQSGVPTVQSTGR